MTKSIFTKKELAHYNRQMLLPGWGHEAQKRLNHSHVFVAGAGGLGSAISIYLAAAGIGHLTLVDNDTVDLSNLNRQILHDSTRIGKSKVKSAYKTLKLINPRTKVTIHRKTLTKQNVDRLVAEADIVVDGLDNFETRYLLNESAIRKGIPLVFAGVKGLNGMVSFIHVPHTPCLRCIVGNNPPEKETFPIVGAVPGILGSLQALEVLKYLTGIGQNLGGVLLEFRGTDSSFKTYRMPKDPECLVCAKV